MSELLKKLEELKNGIIEQIEGQPFMLNKLYRIREAGASIYTTSGFDNKIKFVCQIDFDKILESGGKYQGFKIEVTGRESNAWD